MVMNRLPFDAPGAEGEFQRVEVHRSPRRKKTISAEIVGDVLVVSVPDRISRAEEQEWVARMTGRMSERRRKERLNGEGALTQRAAELADRYLEGIRCSAFRQRRCLVRRRWRQTPQEQDNRTVLHRRSLRCLNWT